MGAGAVPGSIASVYASACGAGLSRGNITVGQALSARVAVPSLNRITKTGPFSKNLVSPHVSARPFPKKEQIPANISSFFRK
jgi:hypothetical protein